ncbi:MAG: leucine-rich repeat domain-containing protein [Oscillospiraceae bacterium]|nr:leucine-rich repeat domain-containing protein [Oscillospiraceae bacterium]
MTTIPDLSGVTEMSVASGYSYAFRNCTSLTGVIDLSSLDTIPAGAFYGCKYITGVKFSNSLTSIGDYAFCSCVRIETLDFPDTLITIGNYAFYNNWLLGNDITTSVESGAVVTDVSSDTTATLDEDTSYSGYTLVIPDSVTSVGSKAFYYSYVCRRF